MAYNDLTSKLEAAMKAVVDALALSGVTVNTGVEEETLAVPFVICAADGTTEEIKSTGIFRCSARVVVASSADDTSLVDHRARVASVFDAFLDDAISTTLSAQVADFYVYDVSYTGQPSAMENRQLKNTLEMEIVCCASDIT